MMKPAKVSMIVMKKGKTTDESDLGHDPSGAGPVVQNEPVILTSVAASSSGCSRNALIIG
jgi:hypothetical protein